jgi:hypothetical protein
MLTFETGIAVGQALASIKDHSERLLKLEASHAELREEVHGLRDLVMRALLLTVLWALGLATNLPADKIGELAAAFLKALGK